MKQVSEETLHKIQDLLREDGFMVNNIKVDLRIDGSKISRSLSMDLFVLKEIYKK